MAAEKTSYWEGRHAAEDSLDSVGWKKKEAARVLDISRSTLYRKVEEYGLSPTVSRRETHERT